MRRNLYGLVDSVLRVRPGEGRLVVLMFLYQAGLVSALMVGRTVRDTLFLRRIDLQHLPLMYVAVSLAVALASFAYARIADRYRRDRLIARTLLLFTATFLVMFACLALELGGHWIYPVLYVLVEATGAISMIQFWTLAGDVFSAREGRRLFGLIGAGGVSANIVGGMLIGSMVAHLGPERLVLFSSFLFLACAVVVKGVARGLEGALERTIMKPSTRDPRRPHTDPTDGVLSSRHLRIVAALVVLTFGATTLVDFQFKALARATFTSEASLASFFGYFYAGAGLVAGIVQLFVTGRVLERAGVVSALLLLPGALLSTSLTMLLLPSALLFFGATAAKGSENVFRYTINDAAMQLLYVPVPAHQRGRAKAFIDGILKPASISVVGLVLVVVAGALTPEVLVRNTSLLTAPLIVAWGTFALAVRRSYVASLATTLRQRRWTDDAPWRPAADGDTVRLIAEQLGAHDAADVLHALELLPAIDADFTPELSRLLMHPSTDVRLRALEQLAASGRPFARELASIMHDRDPAVRAAAIVAGCTAHPASAVILAEPFLKDPSPVVRARAAVSVILHAPESEAEEARRSLEEILESDQQKTRIDGLCALSSGIARREIFCSSILRSLRDPEPSVRSAATDAAARLKLLEAAPSLVALLGDRESAPAAIRALSALGPRVEWSVLAALGPEDRGPLARINAARVLGAIGTPETLMDLMRVLDVEDDELHGTVAFAAAKVRGRHPTARIDRLRIDGHLLRNLKLAYQQLATVEDLGLPHDDLLVEALLRRHRHHVIAALRLFELRHASLALRLVHASLDTPSRSLRANAAEVVDNVLPRDDARRVLPLLDDVSLADKVRAGTSWFEIERKHPHEWLVDLAHDRRPWVAACALFAVGKLGLTSLLGSLAERQHAPQPLVRETASAVVAVLSRLLAATPDAGGARGDAAGLR